MLYILWLLTLIISAGFNMPWFITCVWLLSLWGIDRLPIKLPESNLPFGAYRLIKGPWIKNHDKKQTIGFKKYLHKYLNKRRHRLIKIVRRIWLKLSEQKRQSRALLRHQLEKQLSYLKNCENQTDQTNKKQALLAEFFDGPQWKAAKHWQLVLPGMQADKALSSEKEGVRQRVGLYELMGQLMDQLTHTDNLYQTNHPNQRESIRKWHQNKRRFNKQLLWLTKFFCWYKKIKIDKKTYAGYWARKDKKRSKGVLPIFLESFMSSNGALYQQATGQWVCLSDKLFQSSLCVDQPRVFWEQNQFNLILESQLSIAVDPKMLQALLTHELAHWVSDHGQLQAYQRWVDNLSKCCANHALGLGLIVWLVLHQLQIGLGYILSAQLLLLMPIGFIQYAWRRVRKERHHLNEYEADFRSMQILPQTYHYLFDYLKQETQAMDKVYFTHPSLNKRIEQLQNYKMPQGQKNHTNV